MKNSEFFFRIILFNFIIIGTTGVGIFTADLTGSMKTVAIILFIFLVILMGIIDVILYKMNEFEKLDNDDRINR